MHENLRSTINLKEEYNRRGEDTPWQTLVPAYEYGTFFVLYGKFRGEFMTNEPKKFKIQEADFCLQNYQGLITIGLERVEGEMDVFYDVNLQKPVYVLKVYVKALETGSKITDQEITVKEEPFIRRYQNYGSWTNTNNELNIDIPLRIVIIYDTLSPDYFDKDNLSGSRVIDSVDYERDGDQLLRRKYEVVTPGDSEFENEGNQNVFGRKSAAPRFNESLGTVESYKCYPTYARLT